MSGVEVLAGLGVLATGLFRYNRENFEFDQEQRFEKEELRIKMQVERFTLFREDVRDLVELTVKKMDLYHMVGALFMKACIVYYCEGFFIAAPPVEHLALYYLSNASAAVFVLCGVWLAMHASISSHSHGTKLLTRFIRLPIPGSDQMNTLNARFADFERQDFQQMLRVPFFNRAEGMARQNEWKQREDLAASDAAAPRRSYSRTVSEASLTGDNEAELLQAVKMETQRHVDLFRRLQARWQCYDAYARVCMSLGCRQLVQAITYFILGLTLVESKSYASAVALVCCMQSLGASLSKIDISYGSAYYLDLALLGWAPSLAACAGLILKSVYFEGLVEDEHGRMVPVRQTLTEPRRNLDLYCFLAAFPLEFIWFELLLRAACPTDTRDALPRHFRSVLFMDVFSNVDDSNPDADTPADGHKLSEEQKNAVEERLAEAGGALAMAQAAVRRWRALSKRILTREQQHERNEAQKRLGEAVRVLQDFLKQHRLPLLGKEHSEMRRWDRLKVAEREQDPFRGVLLGPLEHEHSEGEYYFDLEDGSAANSPGSRRVLTLSNAMDKVWEFEREVEQVRAAAGDGVAHSWREEERNRSTSFSEEERTPLTSTAGGRRSRSSSVSSTDTYTDGSKVVSYDPERLPWIIVKCLVRCMMTVWILTFISFLVEHIDGMENWDKIEGNVEERRLAEASWQFESLSVAWPMGSFFRPEGLSCMPGQLLMASPYALYRVVFDETATLEELSDFVSGSSAFCVQAPVSAGLAAPCLFASIVPQGLELKQWRQQQSVTLTLDSAPLRRVTGAIVACQELGVAWCLLFAAWAGGATLSVAALPLPDGPGSLPRAGQSQKPLYELPLSDSSLAALHLAPQGRLWALSESGSLDAWQLLSGSPRHLGSWPRAAQLQGLRPAALCESQDEQSLLVAGRAGVDGGPVLLRARALPLAV